jgi:hypothetical protein
MENPAIEARAHKVGKRYDPVRDGLNVWERHAHSNIRAVSMFSLGGTATHE